MLLTFCRFNNVKFFFVLQMKVEWAKLVIRNKNKKRLFSLYRQWVLLGVYDELKLQIHLLYIVISMIR